MAPEISGGRYGKEVDLYALGVTLYEMLTGRTPFDGESPAEILMKHLTAEPDLSAVSNRFRPVVARLLRKDPDQRFGSATSLLIDLAERLRQTAAESVESPQRNLADGANEPPPQAADVQTPAARIGIPSPPSPLRPQRSPMPDTAAINSSQRKMNEATLVRDQLRITVGLAIAVAGGIGLGVLTYQTLSRFFWKLGSGEIIPGCGGSGIGFLSASFILYMVCRRSQHPTVWGTFVAILISLGVACMTLAMWECIGEAPRDLGGICAFLVVGIVTWSSISWLLYLRRRLKQLLSDDVVS